MKSKLEKLLAKRWVLLHEGRNDEKLNDEIRKLQSKLKTNK